MKENYIYPAKFELVDGLWQVRYLDFPNMSLIEEENKEDALRSAQECLERNLCKEKCYDTTMVRYTCKRK